MKFNFKKKIALLLAVVLTITASAIGLMANAEDSSIVCTINEYNFPDANFRAVVSDWFDNNNDGYLSSGEVNHSTISLSQMVYDTCGVGAKVQSLKGIEFFSGVRRLRASGLGIQVLDCSKLTNLVELTIQGNELTELDLSKNTNLEILNCSSNELTSLDTSANSKLHTVHAYVNKLTSIKFSPEAGNALRTLNIHQNELASLDVSALTSLVNFNCAHNHLTSLDLSQNTQIDAITDATIGSQTVTAPARLDKGRIFVYFVVPNWNSRLVSTSVDKTVTTDEAGTYTQLGYDGVDFTPASYDEIVDGITYYYSVGIADAENMDVTIDVQRDFWQVKYFTDESKTTLFDKQIVFNGADATEPESIEAPQCKKFVQWSEPSSNVTGDREIYAVWEDDHNTVPKKFEGGIVYFDCTKCQNNKSDYDFVLYVNMRSDNEYFAPILDMNNDGVINAKDYALIKKAIK